MSKTKYYLSPISPYIKKHASVNLSYGILIDDVYHTKSHNYDS